jgi:hypothetical protein
VRFLADDVMRGCVSLSGISPAFEDTVLIGLKLRLAAERLNTAILKLCNDRDLCNGSGRLAEISTMMILIPASLVLIISFFSRP